jgi:hypothetical protein
MVADTSPPKAAIKFLADTIYDLQTRVRRLELKTALLGTSAPLKKDSYTLADFDKALGWDSKSKIAATIKATTKEIKSLSRLMGKVAKKKLKSRP